MNCFQTGLQHLLPKQALRLPKAGAMAGDRNGKAKILMIKRIFTATTRMKAWALLQVCNLYKAVILILKKFPTDSTGMIINESALKVMKFKDPIGQIVKDNGTQWHIVGVIKDFILTSPYEPTRPMLIFGAKSWFANMLIKFNNQHPTSVNLKNTEAIFKKYNPEYPFEYKFVDEAYARKFEDEKRIGTLAGIFAALTIFISCLGLFGLATYMAENRIKEIGVRKVLGASVSGITTLLSKDFLKLVFVSFILAAPVAWWAMHTWLQNYTYRVKIQWWVFALAAILSMLIAVFTVSFQAIKAAIANPVKSLRTE